MSLTSESGQWLIRTWETGDGLPENSATAMAQTADGYIWFGTFDGLVRFDGIKFTVFDQSNTPELSGRQVINLHCDQQDRLWISTPNFILFRKGQQWSAPFGREQGWTGDFVRTFAEGAGELFVTSFDGKVFQLDGDRFRELPEPPGVKGSGYFGHVDPQGRFWVAQHGFIGTWDGQQWHEALPADQFLNRGGGAGPARDGGLWLFNGPQLSKMEAGTITKQHELGSEPRGGVWSLTEDSKGAVWIATYNLGLLHVAPNGEATSLTTRDGLSSDSLRFLFEDRDGTYWVGTSGGGLMRMTPRAMFNFRQPAGLSPLLVRSVAIARSNEVLVGTYGRGVVRLTDQGIERVPLPPTLSDATYVHCVLEDSCNRIWVGTFEAGLALLDEQGPRLIPEVQSAGKAIHALFEDSQHRVWIAGDHGVSVFEDGAFRVHHTAAGHPLDRVRAIAEEPGSGVIWLGDSRQRLHRFQDGRFEAVACSGDPIGEIRALLPEPDGTLWVGTSGAGLGRLSNDRFARVGMLASRPVRAISSMLIDSTGRFWLGTEQGLLRASRAQLMEVADGVRPQAYVHGLDQENDGLLTTEFTGTFQPGCAQDHDGRLWFGSPKGLTMVDPKRLQPLSSPPPVHIEAVRFTDDDGKTHSAESLKADLVLPPGSHTVEIHFTALSLAAPNDIWFATRLTRDADEINSNEGNRRTAVFDGLAPGHYRFHVAAGNRDGAWNQEGATLSFILLPFYWQTAWFRLLMAGVLVAGTAAVVTCALQHRHRRAEEKMAERRRAEARLMAEQAARLQSEQEALRLSQRLLTAQETERSRVARELHDDITQRLARLALDAAQTERGLPVATANGTPHSMREELTRLSEDIHRLAYRLHPSTLDELGLVEAVRAECDRLSRQESIQVTLTAEDTPPDIPSDVALCLFRVVQESLRNVVRHARATQVEVTLRRMDDGLQLAVEDNGIGFSPAQEANQHSLGHASMRERVDLVEGELDIESQIGHGTSVVAWVPLTKDMTEV